MTDAVEQYILDHIDTEGAHLQRLNRDAHVNLLRPRMLSGKENGKTKNQNYRKILVKLQ